MLVIVGVAQVSRAQAWSGIIDSTRAIDWTTAGIPGGIPSGTWTQSGSTITATSGDRTTTIANALNACGTNHYVLMGAGSFNVTNITIPNTCELRGAGADQTTLNCTGSGNACVTLGVNNNPSTSTNTAVSGASFGATSITVASASGFSIGGYFQISQLNDGTTVRITTANGTCGFCDGGFGYNGTRSQRQVEKITSVSGTTIGIDPPLYTAYTLTPLANLFTMGGDHAGIENLQIFQNGTGYRDNVFMATCAYCWERGVKDNYADGDHIDVYYGYHDEIRDNYFSNAYGHSSGSTDAEANLAEATTATLLQNNIFDRLHASIILEWGPAGNVVAYNYMTGGFDSSATNVVIGGITYHGAHPQMNLIEGNVGVQIYYDAVWGSSAYSTAFRNWVMGSQHVCSPASAGRNTVSNCVGANGFLTFQASRAMNDSWTSTLNNFVGNVTGSVNQTSNICYGSGCAGGVVNEIDWPTGRVYDTTLYEWSFGFGSAASDGGGEAGDSTVAKSTAFQHGNYSNVLGTINWSGIITHTLPGSFYLAGRPNWWTATMPYPAIGPDVTLGSGPGGHVYSLTAGNPAQYCYTVIMGGSDGGPATPLAFNADTCYPLTASSPPGPPAAPLLARGIVK